MTSPGAKSPAAASPPATSPLAVLPAKCKTNGGSSIPWDLDLILHRINIELTFELHWDWALFSMNQHPNYNIFSNELPWEWALFSMNQHPNYNRFINELPWEWALFPIN